MPIFVLYSFVLLLLTPTVLGGCQTENDQIAVPDSDQELLAVSHQEQQLMTWIDPSENGIIMESELPFTVSDMIYVSSLDEIVLASNEEQVLYTLDPQTGLLEVAQEMDSGINELYYAEEIGRMFAADIETNSVTMFELGHTLQESDYETASTGEHPISLTYGTETNRLYLLNVYDNQIQAFTLEPFKKTEEAQIHERPEGLLAAEDQLFIGGHGGDGNLNENTYIHSPNSFEPVDAITTGLMPIDFSYHEAFESIYILSHGSHELQQLNSSSFDIENSLDLPFNPYYSLLTEETMFVSALDGDQVVSIDPENLTINESIDVSPQPHTMIYLEGNN